MQSKSATWGTFSRAGAAALGLMALSGCAQPTVDPTSQTDRIAEFVNARYDRLEHSLAQFEHYVDLVQAQADIPEALFHEGRSILQVVDGGTQDLIAEFLASRQGATLSETDRAFFQRTVAAREAQAGAVYDAMFERLNANGAGRLVSKLNLLSWYIGGLDMREFLDQIPDELLLECAGQIRAAMLDFDRAGLWEALVSGQGEPLQHYLESGPLPTLEYLTSQQIQPVVENHLNGPLEHLGRSLVAKALGQAFAMHLYDMEYVALRYSGFNDLMGEERAERLHARAMKAVQAMERDASGERGTG
jgi:hypothetical protein